MKDFEFSIIIDIDNCQGALLRTVNSIINQSIYFKENIEIIFIYHESNDDSLNIIQGYQLRYSSNIIILNPEDDLVKHVRGEYVSFLNVKYDYPKLLLEKIKNSFNKHDFNMVYVNDWDFEVMDFEKTYSVIDFNLSQLFIKSNFFKKHFNNDYFIYSLIFNNPKISIVHDDYFIDCENSTQFKYPNDFFNKLPLNNLPDYCKRFILYDIQKYLESGGNNFDLTILNYFDDELIKSHKSLKKNIKSFLIYLKNREFHIDGALIKSKDYIINDLSKNKLYIDIVEITSHELNFTASITSSSFPEDISIVVCQKFKDNTVKTYNSNYEYYPTTDRRNKQYLGINWEFTYHFNVSIPLDRDDFELTFKLLFNGLELSNHIEFREFAGLSNSSNYTVRHSRILLFKGRTFYLMNYSYPKMLKYEVKSLIRILKHHENNLLSALFYRIIYILLFPFFKNKRIWLLSDRLTSAGDNAEYLFDYSQKQDDNVEKYFIIDGSSDDYNRLNAKYDNIVAFDSFKHKLYYLFSEKIITSQVTRGILNPFAFKNSRLYEGVSNYDWCFIQHGVILHDLSNWIHKYNKNFYLFLTSSDYERDSIVNGDYNYSPDRVEVLGLSRYDYLENNPENIIVFAPTWRRKLDNIHDIIDSNYLKSINSFLTNEKLYNYLSENDYKLIFKPHPDLYKFRDLIQSKYEISNESYSEVFKSSSLMITDYSSVAFDFAYLKKPLIYYQTESFDEFHYNKGYFDYETMGFGEITTNEEELISKIIEYVNRDCEMKEKYAKRVDEFFKFQDRNNSKRIYEWLIYL